MKIVELQNEQQIREAFLIVKQLRKQLEIDEYIKLVDLAREIESYKMFGLVEENELRAVIGYMPMITLYSKKSIWVCDLVTDEIHRSKGYGQILLRYVEERAEKEGYERIELSSGLEKEAAHRFYEQKTGFKKASFLFRKNI
ncbi:aminoalkylphosphonic acid N-acetyltransferase [Staphylococcus piscifermentans]|uniref:Putative N-acetyltransferase YhdJ n=1 Tax=Staphylococcus piscifermentans TaxID=70258 RepID=A0A239TTS8_9STAP|nr:GNAT family N-acetyltransferase [Staphylococcus piscifermentans]RTX82571.1 GNAT family N-acetyltransferase [Staphylococcus piscifermentans]GEP84581.1 putative N-acetyltransferase YhdJ [Staphylococcus piscifermentans]SNV00264.1 aminoalkylphosphonic acid N-acetyltransferase [Staphylococcus piscifermentans]